MTKAQLCPKPKAEQTEMGKLWKRSQAEKLKEMRQE